ncbi:hypothetical protein [Flectobacillus roseus]|uniref:hypothetical protein n=1 Tax=Flectobacillus roseus TaxID=502259 RepID=UPI0024B7F727|nr:hypothetical protein [Flectobacillus roseus]MDI9870572.1 hypothetical protein [Flectobacillus roseus]
MTTNEILVEAEELGKLFFTPKEIKVILFPPAEGNIDIAILRGQLISDAEIRKVIIQQAKAGSAEAQKIVEQWKIRISQERALQR